MRAEMGEQIVGAYLKIVLECDVVSYNVRPKGGGMKGLGELDVVGLRFIDQTAFVCECATHLAGLEYGQGAAHSIGKIAQKTQRQQEYSETHLQPFPNRHFMFWSPVVPKAIAAQLAGIEGLELVVNLDYSECVTKLRHAARTRMNDENNDAFRLLQILEHLRKP